MAMQITIKKENNRKIKIMREPTDPLCMRASIGGTVKDGYYLVFRGDDMKQVEDMLAETLDAFRTARQKYIQKFN